ncbi:MAG: hypothetical protein A2826_00055 [Candidatus Doudnabacteria bacterium RIFCSPHIGHO2_01_FULL_43_23]|uniref:Short-chain dehydrogenase n=1 Tax=Candidatus Doudnabacteria bacterium RIFCSPHIGHO2_01_FULL_43_23 TaxID=1817822 RepID=A0A1F5NQG7_9BACT|nr:MAG: hypothetical protein A2826_00055 [Candidatus Doudnabacteria bacterium RIFCSPHIGHO2_01_FULL_43_23]
MKIFITGISSGIGKLLTEKLVMAGHEVWGVARRKDLLSEMQKSLGTEKLKVLVCDLSRVDEMKAVFQKMRDEKFIPDVVVLNAGVYVKDVEEREKVPFSLRREPSRAGFDFEKFQDNMKVNLRAPMYWVSEFLPEFLESRKGTFIAISSTSAYRPGKTSIGYPATKTALSMAFRGLRLNYADSGVKFTTIHFGPIRTRLWSGSKSLLIPKAEKAADFIIKVFGKKSGSYFFPFISTTLLRLSLFLPDSFFTKSSSWLKKR